MPREIQIRQGETIAKIADAEGMTVEKIWHDAANSQLRSKYDNSDILMPGETLTIPDKTEKQESAASDSRHRFKKLIGFSLLKVQLMEDEEPRANIDYILKVDGIRYEGSTDGDGILEQKIPNDANKGTIFIGETEEIPLKIGVMDPIDECSGIQKRLGNLGYDCGKFTVEMNEATAAALRGFQGDNDLDVTGEIDQPTKDKLLELHGC